MIQSYTYTVTCDLIEKKILYLPLQSILLLLLVPFFFFQIQNHAFSFTWNMHLCRGTRKGYLYQLHESLDVINLEGKAKFLEMHCENL